MSTTTSRVMTVFNVWTASWLSANGLTLVRATRPAERVRFEFSDPDGRGPELVAQFFADRHVQRLIDGRRAMSVAMDIIEQRGIYEA